MSGVMASMMRSARRSMSFTGKEVQEVVDREAASAPVAKSPEVPRKVLLSNETFKFLMFVKDPNLPTQLRSEIEHRRRDSGHNQTVTTPPTSPSVTAPPLVASPAAPSPGPVRQARHSIALDEDVRRYSHFCLTFFQESSRFNYEALKQRPAVRADACLSSFEVPSQMEIVTTDRKRRYSLPNNFASLLKEPGLRPYIKYYLNFFAANWKHLRPRPEVSLRTLAPHEPPGPFLPLDESNKDTTTSSTASGDFVEALDLVHNTIAKRENEELLAAAALQSTASKLGGEASPFSEAPVAYRWVQIEPKELKMALGDFEPFYCQFALYDIAKKVRLSEVFTWEMQPPELATPRPPQRAVFSLAYPSPDVCIIVRIEKILQADIETIAEMYSQPDKAKDKDKEKLKRDVKDLLTARGKQASQFRQLLAYGLLPIFNDDRTLAVGDDLAIRPLFRPAKGELNDAALMAMLGERSGSLSLKRMRSIPGQLTLSAVELYDVPTKRLDVSLEGCGGAVAGDDSPSEMQEFSFVPRVTPHIFLVNNLYVYLDSVNLSGRTGGATSGKNICVRVQLLASDKPATSTPLNAIYGREKTLTSAYYSSIQYHNNYDEIKIKLPLAVTPSLHLLFTFMHVPGKAREQEGIIGYAVLPILSNEVLMASKDNSLPIILDTLPGGYLSPEADSEIKWLENKRPLFRCRLSLVSSIYTQDDTLARALSTVEYLPETANTGEESERHTLSGIRLLRLVSPVVLLSFSPPLFTHLVLMLSVPNLQKDAFAVLTDVLHSMYMEATGSALSLAIAYAEFVATPSSQAHEDIVRLWSDAIKSLELNVGGDKLVLYSGFWFRLIIKSMAAVPKPRQFSEGLPRSLRTLLVLLACEESNHARTTLNLAKDLNRNIALFLRDLFDLMDRGFVSGLVERVLGTLTQASSGAVAPPASVMCDLKCDFLRIICESPYFLPVNVPVPHALPSENLIVAWEEQHFLAALLLKTVESYITAQDRPMRTKAIMLLMSVMAQHELDTRCSDPILRDRVGLLYLPWLPLLAQHWSVLSTQYSLEERRRALLTWLWVSNALSSVSLALWWRAAPLKHQAAYLQGLVLCAETFEFAGAVRLAEQMAERPEVDKSLEAKAQLESYYTKQLTPSANPRERFSNLRQRRAELRAADQGAAEPGSVSERPRHVRSLSGGATTGMRVSRSPSVAVPTPVAAAPTPTAGSGSVVGDRSAVTTSATNLSTGSAIGLAASTVTTEAHERALAAAVSNCLASLADAFVDFLLQNGASLRSAKRDPLVDGAVELFATMLSKQQTLMLLRELYTLLRRHMPRLGPVFFLTRHNYVSRLVAAALAHCVSSNVALASAACQHLYLLCCTNASLLTDNFARMKIQLTIALSQFVSQGIKEEDNARLRRSLLALRERAEKDRPGSVFATQVGELISALQLVLSETAGLRDASDDSYRVCDQLLRLAAGHRHAPELRVAWLESLANFHTQAKNYAEAAECHLRVAALVYSCVSLPGGTLPRALFIAASPNLQEEFDGVPKQRQHVTLMRLMQKGTESQSGTTFESPAFGAEGFVRNLDSAVQSLMEAQLFERASDACKIITAYLEATRDYVRLVDVHARLQSIFEKLAVCVKNNIRQLGSYYRVTFFGTAFGELDGQAFVYREAKSTRLGEMRERLEQVFHRRLGGERKLQVMTDAKDIDRSRLDATQAYMQITSVEPLFAAGALLSGHTNRFVFDTPYTLDGQSYAPSIADQYKRKVILKTEKPFPDLAMRSKVVSRTEKVSTPIENAVEILEEKTAMLHRESSSSTPSIKLLQLGLAGCVRTQVNQGPQEICRAFLSGKVELPKEQIAHLCLVFRNFLSACGDALQVNKTLIGPEQMAFHQELEQGFKQLCSFAAEFGVSFDRGYAAS